MRRYRGPSVGSDPMPDECRHDAGPAPISGLGAAVAGPAPAPDERSTGADAPWSGRRFAALDVARALAFGGMLLSHFAASTRRGDPGWLQALDSAADGRAAPLFCLLLGVGAGVLSARGTPDAKLVRRGLVLFVLGMAVWPYVDRVHFILPHYGLLLAMVPWLRRLPTNGLLAVAAGAFAVPSVVVAVVAEPTLRTARQPDGYGDLTAVVELVRYLAWSGAYPMVGWVGFVLVGLWLARQRLDRRPVQVGLLAGGVAGLLLQPVFAAVYAAFEEPPGRPGGLAAFFDGTAHSNMFAWYVLGSATAVAVVAACALVIPVRRGLARAAVQPVVFLGQLALTSYLAHIVLGEELVWEWRDRTRPSLAVQMALVAAVFAAFALASTAWRARFRRGPLEAAVRTLAA